MSSSRVEAIKELLVRISQFQVQKLQTRKNDYICIFLCIVARFANNCAIFDCIQLTSKRENTIKSGTIGFLCTGALYNLVLDLGYTKKVQKSIWKGVSILLSREQFFFLYQNAHCLVPVIIADKKWIIEVKFRLFSSFYKTFF